MQPSDARRAAAAAVECAAGVGLTVERADVLNNSNRLALRLMPCDVVARVAATSYRPSAERAVEVARRLAAIGAPVAGLDPRVEPRVYLRDGFVIDLWTYYECGPWEALEPAGYARALERLHAAMRQIDVATPHFMDRVASSQEDVENRGLTPDLAEADRALLGSTLRRLKRSVMDRGAREQLLHGEPHPWNILDTEDGPLFIDFEDAVRGPVEYDLAWVPEDVSAHYEAADPALVDECRGLMLAIVATWRWRSDDQHPSGRPGGVAYLNALRAGPPWPSVIRW
jgi:hypothetical protein